MRPLARVLSTAPLSSVLLLALLASSCRPVGEAAEPETGPAVALAQPVPRPDVTLPDAQGELYDFRARTGGRPTLLFFGYTYCPDICPVHLANLAAVLRDLPLEVTRELDVVFVTVDPERDTPERLQEWLDALHPRFVGLRGSRDEVVALERSLGLPASVVDPTGGPGGEYFVGHAGQILVFGADDTARVAYPFGVRQRDWRRDLPRLVRGDLTFTEP